MSDASIIKGNPEIIEFADAAATSFELLSPDAVRRSTSELHHPVKYPHVRMHTLGAVYDREGQIIEHSLRSGGHGGDHVTAVDPTRIPEVQLGCTRSATIAGRSLFLGPFMNHYGHFITESLSRCWMAASDELRGFDNYLFYPFIFDSGRVHISETHLYFFNLLGIAADRIIILDKPAHLEHVTIPNQLWVINSPCNPFLLNLYTTIRAAVPRHSRNQRLFLSRKSANSVRFPCCAEVEALFVTAGFQIVYPEELSITTQLQLYASCKVMAGFSGSALHNSLFVEQGTLVMEIGDMRTRDASLPMQLACNKLTGLPYIYIPYREIAPGLPDLEKIRRRLEEMLQSLHPV